MRISAQTIFAVLFLLVITNLFSSTAYAQTPVTPTPLVATSAQSSNNNYLELNTDPNVPQNRDTYTQVVLINMVSAIMCQLTGIDTTNPQQSCLGVDPTTGKIGMAPAQALQDGQSQTQIGGAVALMSNYISTLYVPPITSSQYTDYLADNFGIVHTTFAATQAQAANCPTGTFGFGFCGLTPIFDLWTGIRDLAYAMLTILFIAIGIGVMIRFRVDPRTVMTLQNQIPRVIIAIILITFSYSIAAGMIDLMWTATYAGINFISAQSNAKVALCPPYTPQNINDVVETRLADDPLSFTNTVFRGKCQGAVIDSGLLSLSSDVSESFGDLVTQTISDLLQIPNGCGYNLNVFHDVGCITIDGIGKALIWFTEQIVKLIIIVALLIALFRLWFQLIKAYVTFLIFVIMGPMWIVFGLVPGRPLGFEKWFRIIFANLAVFPLVAFVLVFARVIVDAIPPTVDLNNTFIPPLIGNPNLSTFTSFIGFGAIMMAPSIPDLIKERMKATGQGQYGKTIAAGIGFSTGIVTSPGRKTWEGLNRRNSMTGAAEGSVAIMRDRMLRRAPVLGSMQKKKLQRIRDEQSFHHYGKTQKEIEEEARKKANSGD